MERMLRCGVVLLLLVCAVPAGAQEEYQRVQRELPELGCGFPEFSLPDPSGRMVSLGENRGRIVILSFGACYADTCCAILQAFEELFQEFGEANLAAILVCSEVAEALTKEGFAGLVEKCGGSHTVLLDADRAMKNRFKVRKLPTTFLLDRNLCVQARVSALAALHSPEFLSQVRGLLQAP